MNEVSLLFGESELVIQAVQDNKQAIPEARTKAQAERAEVSEREAIYNRRYNKGTDIGFRDFYDEHYLPWLREKKPSQVLDAESRVKKLREFFGNRMLSDITRRDVERFQLTLRGKKTPRRIPRKGATINRYVYLLSAIFSRAIRDEVVDFNPCNRFEQEPEARRERYLLPSEQSKLMEELLNDLAYLRAPIEVSLGTGVRKHTELLKLQIENINFGSLSVFRPATGRDVEVRPNWFLLVDTKGKHPRHRLMPMNGPVRAALQKVIDSRTTGNVFDYKQTGVSASTLRRGFEVTTEAGIPFGLTVEGGVICTICDVLLQPSCEGDKCTSTTLPIYSVTLFKASPVHTHAAHRRRWKMQSTDSQSREVLCSNSKERLVESVTILAPALLLGLR